MINICRAQFVGTTDFKVAWLAGLSVAKIFYVGWIWFGSHTPATHSSLRIPNQQQQLTRHHHTSCGYNVLFYWILFHSAECKNASLVDNVNGEEKSPSCRYAFYCQDPHPIGLV